MKNQIMCWDIIAHESCRFGRWVVAYINSVLPMNALLCLVTFYGCLITRLKFNRRKTIFKTEKECDE